MERATPDGFREAPAGRFVAGRTWAHGCPHPGLFVVVLVGRPDREELAALVRSLAVELEPRVPPHRSIVDASRLEGVDQGAFEELAEYVRRRHGELADKVERLCLVRPPGLEGAVVAGFFGVLPPPYPVSVAATAREGLAALGEAPDLAERLDAVAREVTGVDPTVAALRDHLAAHLGDATIEGACRALAVSDRTLQRRLGEAGTSFRQELLAARLRAAERLLLSSGDPLTSVALDCGFSSLSHFSSKFHEATGMSPSAFRERGRRRG